MKSSATRYLALLITLLILLLVMNSQSQAAPCFQGRTDCDALYDEGVTFYLQAQYSQALQHYQDALACYREAGDRAMEGATLNDIGLTYHRLGRYNEALDYSGQALGIRREIGDQAGEGTTLNNIGLVYSSLGQYQEALDFFEQALTTVQEIGYQAGEAPHRLQGPIHHIRLCLQASYGGATHGQGSLDRRERAVALRARLWLWTHCRMRECALLPLRG